MDPFYLDRPLIFAHRGACHAAPENTLAAFLAAADLGADGIEFDVHLSSDGQVVVIHDSVLDRTTDGTGIVAGLSLDELQELDAGSWFGPEFSGQRIPTFQQVIDAVGDTLLLNVELKSARIRDEGLVRAIICIVDKNGLQNRVVLSSFNPLILWQVRRLAPRIPIGLLWAPDVPFLLRKPWSRHFCQPDALHPFHTLIDAEFMAWARVRGYRVHTWTVDELEGMQRLTQLGVDLLITNRPDLLRSALQFGQEPQVAQR